MIRLPKVMKESILNQIYQVRQHLGRRGSRETLLAENINTNELVVVKILKFGLDAAWDDFKLFEREALTLKNLTHPAIPHYLDYFELDLPHCKGFALVQEYIEAPSLEATLKEGRTFSELEIREIAEVLLDILQYLHQRQPAIVHRDLKPSNILLSDSTGNSVGQIHLIDFGAVKSLAATDGGTITVVGTYGYMPPEQFGGRTTPASDLYSLGATLIYLATGRHPTELPSKDGKIVFEEAVSLSLSLTRWLQKMTEPSGDRRFKSATEALKALKQPNTLQNSDLVKQPAYSKIKLHKTPEEIDIDIPPQGFTPELIFLIGFAIAWNSFLILWTGGAVFMAPFPINLFFSLFSIPFWTVGVSMVGMILFTIFGSTRLKINSKKISLTYKCLWFKYRRPKPTARHKIAAVSLTKLSSEGKTQRDIMAVTIWADAIPYRIQSISERNSSQDIYARNLSTIELDWLAQELSEWLNLPVTRE